MALKDYLPKFINDILQIGDILQAIDPSLEELSTNVIDKNKELYVKTTELAIEKWEADFDITPNEEKSLDERKAVILSKLSDNKTLTTKRLYDLIENNYSDLFEVTFDYANYSFTVILKDNKEIETLYNALYRARPSHLAFALAILLGEDSIEFIESSVIISLLKKYCGTFVSGVNPL